MKQHVYTTLAIFLLSIPCVRAQHAAPRQSSIPARVDSLLLVEWPERLGEAAWADALWLTLDVTVDGARRLTAKVPAAWKDRWSPI